MAIRGAWTRRAITVSGSFGKATETHVQNFLDCVRTGATPNAKSRKRSRRRS